MRYGGNTSCVEVRVGDELYIFDCGTGFRVLGQSLRHEFNGRPVSAHVFVSHFHWDHIREFRFSARFTRTTIIVSSFIVQAGRAV